jgi:putative exosortase-associated protein (TIGR04073 family)
MPWTRGGLILLVLGVVGLGGSSAVGHEARATSSGQDRVDEALGRYNLHPAFEKLGRGLSNALCGWLEIPLGVHQRYAQSDTAGSLLTGVAYGLFKGAVRTGVGLYETATFFLPYPEDFAPILPTLAYFQKTTKRRPLPFE